MKVCVMHEAGHGSDIVSQVMIVASILLSSMKASIPLNSCSVFSQGFM